MAVKGRYVVLHSDGRRTVVRAERWWVQHFHDGPDCSAGEKPPAPACLADGAVHIFDPRCRVMNAATEEIEYDGAALWTVRDGRITER